MLSDVGNFMPSPHRALPTVNGSADLTWYFGFPDENHGRAPYKIVA